MPEDMIEMQAQVTDNSVPFDPIATQQPKTQELLAVAEFLGGVS